MAHEVTLKTFFRRGDRIKVCPIQGVAAQLQGMNVGLFPVTFIDRDADGILVETREGLQFHPWSAIGYIEQFVEGKDAENPTPPVNRILIPQGVPGGKLRQ